MPSAKGIAASLKSEISGETSGMGEQLADSIFGKFKSAVSKLAIGAAIGGVFKQAIDQGAKLQQSIGGIETLFKDSAPTVEKYAKQAFKTAGLSANDYMEQATSFAAGLVASCGGNTAQAAETANTALVDMSDNANKMGTSMDSLQMAYQGFAKQNYTMLDNLDDYLGRLSYV